MGLVRHFATRLFFAPHAGAIVERARKDDSQVSESPIFTLNGAILFTGGFENGQAEEGQRG